MSKSRAVIPEPALGACIFFFLWHYCGNFCGTCVFLRDRSGMRFAIPPPGNRIFEWGKRGAERSLAARLAVIVLPFGLALCLLACWLGFRAASSTLEDVLPAAPLLEAGIRAERIESALARLRSGLFLIAQMREINPKTLRENLPLFLHEYAPLVAECGLKSNRSASFLLLRDKPDAFVPVMPFFAVQDSHAPFLQLGSLDLRPGEVALHPAVRVSYAGALEPNQVFHAAVIRLALLLDGDRGILFIGLDLDRLAASLSAAMRDDSSQRIPARDGALRLAYFFDPAGWMIFEMDNRSGRQDFFPDIARRGYEGDLGRQGFDAAFRPWAAHEAYWSMVTNVLDGHSGFLPFPSGRYALPYSAMPASQCYVPVTFSPRPGAPPNIVGGVAFLETSRMPLTAFFRGVNAALFGIACAFAVLVFVVGVIGRELSAPLRRAASQLQTMLHTGRPVPLAGAPACTEQQVLFEVTNELITRNLALQGDMERIQLEMRQASSILPVDLDDVTAGHDLRENFGLFGSSFHMQKVREEVRKAGLSGADVLAWGETGTGKELVAAAIHQSGVGAEGPFIPINCGALDENLLLDSLFGHVKGAFTEAKSDRKGAFLSAEGGTLFLDEVSNASFKVQQALLRALSIRRIRPLGSDSDLPFSARVVAATNVDLREQVRNGLVREDLYYRLAIISIATPPLRRRKEDIPELAAFFIREAGKRLTRDPVRLSRGALEAMMEYSWPGNVRELKNCITRAMAFMEGDIILRRHILLDFEFTSENSPRNGARGENAPSAGEAEEPRFTYSWEYLWGRPVLSPPAPEPPVPPVSPVPQDVSPDVSPGVAENGRAAGTDASSSAPDAERAHFSPVFPALPEEREETKPAAPDSRSGAALSLPPLNDRQMSALRHIRARGVITRSEYEELAGDGISVRTMQNDLRHLVDLGVLRKTGGGPKTRYVLLRPESYPGRA
jgi:transcriptional regulator with AAA-type ATPase domain